MGAAVLAMAVARLLQAAWQAPDAPEMSVGDPAFAAHETMYPCGATVRSLRIGLTGQPIARWP